jgi:DNA-binding NtrC family response regulator
MSTGSLDTARQDASRGRILVVDDDGEMRALLAEVLREAGYDVKEAVNGAEALIRLRAEPFTAIVLDKNMPGLSGLDLLPGMRVICPGTPIVLITAFGDVGTYVDAIERGACAYLFKPFRMEELLQTLERALAAPQPSIPTSAIPGGYHESAR